MSFASYMIKTRENGIVPERFLQFMQKCYDNYCQIPLDPDHDWKVSEQLFCDYLMLIEKQFQAPFLFEPFHKKVTEPFNFEAFSLAFIQPLIIFEQSKILGEDNLKQITSALDRNENVILLANHQTEPDPQILNLMLQKDYPRLADEMIFIAGDRVVTDPMAVPSSLGCNLLCIYSKKHVENPPELKEEKLKHNQRTMKMMSQLLSQGGKCIYVAPSGGRDRPGKSGSVEVAPFHPQSIEMLWLMSRQADRPTHFYPLALGTYNILPPPDKVDIELGEDRIAKKSPVHLAFGKEINMTTYPGNDEEDRKRRRQNRANYIWNLVNNLYQQFS